MSEEAKSENVEMGTKPIAEHAWLNNLLGDWKTVSEMVMGPDQPTQTSEGTETVTSLGGLFAFGEGKATMPDGTAMEYKSAIGYDVSFKQYRGVWFASMSSHLWKSEGELSEDGKVLTLTCVGPNMEKDGETAIYRDVHELVDANTRTMTSSAETPDGWQQFMKVTYTRA
jgi:hypothetical protein